LTASQRQAGASGVHGAGGLTSPPDPSYHRAIDAQYLDPVDVIWLGVARRLGFRVVRSPDVWAGFDGRDTIALAPAPLLDADDCLAQMILHELCHALVEGREGLTQRDWGLENVDDRDLAREIAALRVQAAFADRFALRGLLASTTDWRQYWDRLPEDPLQGPSPDMEGRGGEGVEDPSLPLARRAMRFAEEMGWDDVIQDGLAATARVADAVRAFAGPESLWSRARELHPVGLPVGTPGRTCGTCGWKYVDGAGDEGQARCRQQKRGGRPGPVVEPSWRACVRWEPRLTVEDCAACGACCREGFHVAPVEPDEDVARRHAELLVEDDGRLVLPRPDGACVALRGGRIGDRDEPYRCAIYDVRPRACRDLPVGGDACLLARRRVGLSR